MVKCSSINDGKFAQWSLSSPTDTFKTLIKVKGVQMTSFFKIYPLAKGSFTTEGLPDYLFAIEAGVTFLEASEPVLCCTFIDNSWAFYINDFF